MKHRNISYRKLTILVLVALLLFMIIIAIATDSNRSNTQKITEEEHIEKLSELLIHEDDQLLDRFEIAGLTDADFANNKINDLQSSEHYKKARIEEKSSMLAELLIELQSNGYLTFDYSENEVKFDIHNTDGSGRIIILDDSFKEPTKHEIEVVENAIWNALWELENSNEFINYDYENKFNTIRLALAKLQIKEYISNLDCDKYNYTFSFDYCDGTRNRVIRVSDYDYK